MPYKARTVLDIISNGSIRTVVIDVTPYPRIGVQERRALIWIVLESEHHAILEVWRISHVQLQEHIFTAHREAALHFKYSCNQSDNPLCKER